MSTITDLQVSRFKESENKRHLSEMRKLKSENATEYRKEATHNDKLIGQLHKEFEAKSSAEETNLERQLTEMRRKQEKRIGEENQRLEEELKNLKSAHADQVNEIKISNMNEIEKLRESQQRTLANAKEKFIQEKTKWEA